MEQTTPSIIYCNPKRKDCSFKTVCKRNIGYVCDNNLPHTDLTCYLEDSETHAMCGLFILNKE